MDAGKLQTMQQLRAIEQLSRLSFGLICALILSACANKPLLVDETLVSPPDLSGESVTEEPVSEESLSEESVSEKLSEEPVSENSQSASLETHGCPPSYSDEFSDNSASMTPIQAEVWLRNIIREPAYSPLGNELISKLSEGRDADWASLVIGRGVTRTGSSYVFYLHDGVILRKELDSDSDKLSEEDAQIITLNVTDCDIGGGSAAS